MSYNIQTLNKAALVCYFFVLSMSMVALFIYTYFAMELKIG